MTSPLPRLHFAATFIPAILAGAKTATTRLCGERDPTSDLSLLSAGGRCSATSGAAGEPFAKLDILSVEVRSSREVCCDEALAAREGCRDAEELAALLASFYPHALRENAQLLVVVFAMAQGAEHPG